MKKLYIYKLDRTQGPGRGPEDVYDEAAAAVCLQGVFNREEKDDRIYLLDEARGKSKYWLDVFSAEGEWMSAYEQAPLSGFSELLSLALPYMKCRVIWDVSVPATVNAAFTAAGVRDGIVLSEVFASKYEKELVGLPILDFRGAFDESVTGSAKNDVYRRMIDEYLAAGRCSKHLLCLYEDCARAREACDLGYVLTRDWAIYNRAFVYDLSPWGDETPKDDPEQTVGSDLATYRIMLSTQRAQMKGEQMSEVAGFFCFWKYSNIPGWQSVHEPVPTEWETVWLISEYDCYQNTVASDCLNQSFHSQHPMSKLSQGRPSGGAPLQNKCYVCIHMADYDSATPLYEFLPDIWNDPRRGEFQKGWGINPNLCETYPDIFEYLYRTKTDTDWFVSDASAAGYFNPNRIRPESWDMVIAHNKRFFELADMTMAPMVLDWDEPSDLAKDNFVQFSPDGLSIIVIDYHGNGGRDPEPHVWKGMPVDRMYNGVCDWAGEEKSAERMLCCMKNDQPGRPFFHMIRIVWTAPGNVADMLEIVRRKRPDLDIELVSPYDYFRLRREELENRSTASSF